MTIETVQPPRPRAGFWRRLLAFVLDGFVVLMPFTIIAAISFGLSGGRIQSAYGLLYPFCTLRAELPADLTPQPLSDFNFIEDCRLAFPGMDTGRVLRVGNRQPEQVFGQSASQTYWLDPQGRPSDVVLNLGLIAFLAYPIYAILMESRSGQTLGKRLLRIKVIDPANATREGVAISKAFWRQAAMFVLSAPAYGAQLFAAWFLIPTSESFLEVVTNPIHAWVDGLGMVAQLFFTVVIVVALARKRDPIYDRFAGTAVILA